MKNKIRLLALDTSVRDTGYSLFENGILVDYGNLTVSKTECPKINIMTKKIGDLLNRIKPDIVVVENTVVLRNARIQRELTMILGGIYFWAINHNKFFYTFNPSEWRKLVKDNDEDVPKRRTELKQWSLIKASLIANTNITNDNSSDAILIGQAYCNQFNRGKKK